jgi:hypothetical protein
MFCKECGSEVKDNAFVCVNCGVTTRSFGKKGPVDKTVYIVLALFLGGIGAHKFYEGKIGMGIIYLAFCWTFVPAFVALFEAICALGLSQEAFAIQHS